jgi:hypothetical protein
MTTTTTTTTTTLDLDAIKATDYQPDRNGAAAYRQSDLAAQDVPALVAEVERLRAQMAAVEKFVAARAEYITAINNCPPDNSADYWRWQGHAEGRRQLSQTLGLPVGWPADYDSSDV